MSLNAKKEAGGGKDFVKQGLLEVGTYPGRSVQVIDLGIQPQRPYQGQPKPPVHQFSTTYEMVDEFMKDEDGNDVEDKPRWMSETMPFYNLNNEKANSTKRYNALDPDGAFDGDWSQLVDIPCNLVVGEYVRRSGPNAGEPANCINGITTMRAKDADRCAPLVNPPKVFLLDDPDMEVFGSLPEWLQDKIKANLEYAGSKLEELVGGVVEPEAILEGDKNEW